jgi:hypothetical protein
VFALCAAPPKERTDKEIAGWVALAALCHRYSRSSDTMIDQDLKACRREDPIGALLGNLRNRRQSLIASRHDFDTSVADRSGVFAAYVACAFLGNKDLLSGGRTLARKKIQKHHILPRSRFEQGVARNRADVVANIGFIAADSNKSIGDEEPTKYLGKIPSAVLESQAIPLDRSLWSIDRAEEFWIERQELLSSAFNNFIKQCLSGRHLT